jgi:hypothetical protein
VSPGSWSNDPSSFTYQWQSCSSTGNSCASIVGATGTTHTLTQADVGRRLRAVVGASNASGSGAATSAITTVVGSRIEAAWLGTFTVARTYTIVVLLVIEGVPQGASVEVSCHGRGCPFARDHAASKTDNRRCATRKKCKGKRPPGVTFAVNLASLLRGKHLAVGTRISVNVVKAGWVGKSFLFTMRSSSIPREQSACLASGSSTPGVGC